MDPTLHNKLVSFVWGIADDVLRDVLVRGKYRDAILPMVVIRRLDVILESTDEEVRKTKKLLDDNGINEQYGALCSVSGQPFYNTSQFTLKSLLATGKKQELRLNLIDYLDGFSPNVQEILDKFDFRNLLQKLQDAGALYSLIEKFVSPSMHLGPEPATDADGIETHPGVDNHTMGTIFEHLIRMFNEENNEEAGEHWTPRDVVQLMANLIFKPIADQIEDNTYLVYDGACGTGGMLTVADETLTGLAEDHGKAVSIHLYGQELQPETYAICKADLLLKGEGEEAANIIYGSTLGADGYPAEEFDFMLSNPPYGKSWKMDLDRLCDGKKADMTDPRFVTELKSEYGDDDDYRMITRSSDGQLMFLVNMLSKMKHNTPLGSRIAEVHNGSSLFTGDAGQGESNIRRWIIENDWLEAIVALPLNIFYNTGIATYIWVLTNRKPENRRGKVQLIDATKQFEKLRKNLGSKTCKLNADHIQTVTRQLLDFEESETSKIFDNEAFGYWKITVERPLRLRTDLTPERLQQFAAACESDKRKSIKALPPLVEKLAEQIGAGPHMDWEAVLVELRKLASEMEIKANKTEQKFIRDSLAETDELAEPVVAKRTKLKKGETVDEVLQELLPSDEAGIDKSTEARGRRYGFHVLTEGKSTFIVEHEPDSSLRDTEQIPLLEEGGIEAFFEREVRPHVADAWIDAEQTKVGYEIPFTRHFYRYTPLRSLSEITTDIQALEKETEGLLEKITEVVS
ncbi:type I restriction-modification system subunit M [Rosistilla oblonga]|uniref:type I restriction-modification system subunit M n=1 Tax=Rosistilla oblonga TaxID=2527990 RepID=UPI00119E5C68|nr:class I SAM-dependent DNA methyltransferase [Rosistilla oblonga]